MTPYMLGRPQPVRQLDAGAQLQLGPRIMTSVVAGEVVRQRW